jgi:hypothetical protein
VSAVFAVLVGVVEALPEEAFAEFAATARLLVVSPTPVVCIVPVLSPLFLILELDTAPMSLAFVVEDVEDVPEPVMIAPTFPSLELSALLAM